jgi:hypothetical protein
MNSKRLIVISMAILVVSIIGILLLPANSVLSDALFKHKRLSFSAITGYWWHGEVEGLSVDYRGYRIDVGQLHWRFDWQTLASTNWCVDGANSASQELIDTHFRLCYQLVESRFQIIDSVIEIDAKTLAKVSGLEIAGQWVVNISSATIVDSRLLDVYGEAVWTRAQWHNGESWFALGDVLSILAASEPFAINIEVSDLNSPLQIELTTTFSPQQQWAVTGFIEPYAQLPTSLAESLELMSSNVAGKRYYFNY